MPEMEGSNTKPPQITEMFQKFALSFKSKAFEFFSEDDQSATVKPAVAVDGDDSETISLLESAEEFISGQKVVVVKADPPPEEEAEEVNPPTPTPTPTSNEGRDDAQFNRTLITSLFATISSFEASYLQLQTAHVPFDEESIMVADKALVSHLQTLSEFKQLHKSYYSNPNLCIQFSTGSCLEFQVNENQGKLRALKSVFNRLQSEIDVKDDQVSSLRKKLEGIQKLNSKLTDNLSCSSCSDQNFEVLLTVKVFDAMLHDACRLVHKFTKLLIELMKKNQWDLHLVANSLYSDVDYSKKEDNRYAVLSYVCIRMFQGFDSEFFGLTENRSLSNGHLDDKKSNAYLKKLIDHVTYNPMDLLRENPSCEFSRFCENKYRDLIHPTMESSIFIDFSQKEVVLSSWKSLSVFYEMFVKMAGSIWALHKLAYSLDPPVEIFQVERGVEISMVYMEDVTRRFKFSANNRPKVGFTVVPGFKVGKTVIQSQVYLTGMKYGA